MTIDSILRPRLLLSVVFAGLLFQASGQVKFTAIASQSEITRTDILQVEYVIDNAQHIEDFEQPAFKNFLVLRAQVQSGGQTVVNGAVSQYKAWSYLLQPLRTGSFILPGAQARVDGKTIRSNLVTVLVKSPGGTTASRPDNSRPNPGQLTEQDMEVEYFIRPGEDIDEKIRRNLFIRVELSKTSCFEGEPIMVTYKLYSRLHSESTVARHPSLNGFSVYDMMNPSLDLPVLETVNGKPFRVHIIRKAQLIPLQAGTITLDPVEIENTIHFQKLQQHGRTQSRDPLEQFIDRLQAEESQQNRIDRQLNLESRPAAVIVRPLPIDHRPGNFNGAVGQFMLEVSMESKNIVAQDPATLILQIRGRGNLPVINAPPIDWPSGITAYGSTAKEDVDKTFFPLGGQKTFSYSFMPTSAGKYSIPPIGFSYFDPLSGSYKSAESQPIFLQAAPAASTRQKDASRAAKGPDEKGPGLISAGRISGYLPWLAALALLGGLLGLGWSRGRKKGQAIAAAELYNGLHNQQPIEEDFGDKDDPLQHCRDLLAKGDYRDFYLEMNRVLWQALSETLRLRASDLNKQQVSARLSALGWDKQATGLLENTLYECEMKLYTPAYNQPDTERLLQSAALILKALSSITRP